MGRLRGGTRDLTQSPRTIYLYLDKYLVWGRPATTVDLSGDEGLETAGVEIWALQAAAAII